MTQMDVLIRWMLVTQLIRWRSGDSGREGEEGLKPPLPRPLPVSILSFLFKLYVSAYVKYKNTLVLENIYSPLLLRLNVRTGNITVYSAGVFLALLCCTELPHMKLVNINK